MSSTPALHMRDNVMFPILFALGIPVVPLAAQEASGTASSRREIAEPAAPTARPDVIDILARPTAGEIDQRRVEQCDREREAATISGEIVVCREIVDGTADYYSADRNAAQQRYAEETAFANDLPPPDVAGPGIFRGPATVGSLCIPGLQKCPPPPALMIDVTALPEAPPGSDADRISRGLPPLGASGDGGRQQPVSEADLGLPPALNESPETEEDARLVSPAGLAEPEADR